MYKKVIFLLVLLVVVACEDTRPPSKYDIVDLRFKSRTSVHGAFFLGIGSFGSSTYTYYYLYGKDSKGFIRYFKINVENCLLRFGPKPKLELISYRESYGSYNIVVSECVITVPKGTIRRNFELAK